MSASLGVRVAARAVKLARRWSNRRDIRVAARLTSIEHAQRLAHRRIPDPVQSYLEGGAGAETTLEANLAAVRSVGFIPRVGVATGAAPRLRTTVLDHEVAMPLVLGPVGFTRMMHSEGDVAGAAAAGRQEPSFRTARCPGTPWMTSLQWLPHLFGFSSISWVVGREQSSSSNRHGSMPTRPS